jgi:hypothetical protein
MLVSAFAVLTLIATTAGGCGNPSDKVIVAGRVTFDGKAVTNGDIRFFPAQGGTGRVSGAPIMNGVYEANYQGGVPVGTHRVEIRAFVLEGVGPAAGLVTGSVDITTKASQASASGKLPIPVYVVEGRQQFLPPKYNARSELEVTITGENDHHTQDFELTSK